MKHWDEVLRLPCTELDEFFVWEAGAHAKKPSSSRIERLVYQLKSYHRDIAEWFGVCGQQKWKDLMDRNNFKNED